MKLEPLEVESAELESTGLKPSEPEPTELESAELESTGLEPTGPEPTELESAELESTGLEPTGPGRKQHRTTPRQIAAIIAIVLLVLLYLSTLITALFDLTSSGTFFRLSLIGTFTIPLITWIYIWMYGKLTGKHSMADPPQEANTPERNGTPAGSKSLKGTKP